MTHGKRAWTERARRRMSSYFLTSFGQRNNIRLRCHKKGFKTILCVEQASSKTGNVRTKYATPLNPIVTKKCTKFVTSARTPRVKHVTYLVRWLYAMGTSWNNPRILKVNTKLQMWHLLDTCAWIIQSFRCDTCAWITLKKGLFLAWVLSYKLRAKWDQIEMHHRGEVSVYESHECRFMNLMSVGLWISSQQCPQHDAQTKNCIDVPYKFCARGTKSEARTPPCPCRLLSCDAQIEYRVGRGDQTRWPS